MLTSSDFSVLFDGLVLPESPRWHAGRFWFSDMHAGVVYRSGEYGSVSRVAGIAGKPSGLGFLRNGDLLVVDMTNRAVVRVDAGTGRLSTYANLSSIATGHCNDMWVDRHGRAYVGNHGDDSPVGTLPYPAHLAVVRTDGTAEVAADSLYVPNGMGKPDDDTLLVAETRSEPPRITEFAVGPAGRLAERRTVIEFSDFAPDGIAIDALGNVWAASPFTRELAYIQGGRLTHRVSFKEMRPFACALGGTDGRTLFVCAAKHWGAEASLASRSGQILVARAPVPSVEYF